KKVEPVYPPLARQARIQGDVYLQASTGADGLVTNVDVVSGHPLLVPAAIDAVKQWLFPVGAAGRFVITVPFRLDGGSAALGQSPAGYYRTWPREQAAAGYPVPGGVVGGVRGGVPGGVVGGVIGGVPGGVADGAQPVAQ